MLEGTAHSLVDVSHRQIGLIASGPATARVLNAGCPLDLDPRAFPVGFATRTLFDKIEIVLWRRAETTFHVEVWRSFAPYLAASFAEAARGAPELVDNVWLGGAFRPGRGADNVHAPQAQSRLRACAEIRAD